MAKKDRWWVFIFKQRTPADHRQEIHWKRIKQLGLTHTWKISFVDPAHTPETYLYSRSCSYPAIRTAHLLPLWRIVGIGYHLSSIQV